MWRPANYCRQRPESAQGIWRGAGKWTRSEELLADESSRLARLSSNARIIVHAHFTIRARRPEDYRVAHEFCRTRRMGGTTNFRLCAVVEIVEHIGRLLAQDFLTNVEKALGPWLVICMKWRNYRPWDISIRVYA